MNNMKKKNCKKKLHTHNYDKKQKQDNAKTNKL